MVITDLPSIFSVVGRQDFTALPSMITVQVPQAPSLHPSFVPFRPRFSRRKGNSFLLISVWMRFPFTKNVYTKGPLISIECHQQ